MTIPRRRPVRGISNLGAYDLILEFANAPAQRRYLDLRAGRLS